MAWSASGIFIATLEDTLEGTTAFDLNSDTWNVALFGDLTPDKTVASANAAYGAGVWASGEVYDGAEWAQGGQALDSVTSAFSGTVYTFDAADETSAGSSFSGTAIYGCLIYNATVSTPVDNQALAFLYFGGSNTVTDGSFTCKFNGSGIATITV